MNDLYKQHVADGFDRLTRALLNTEQHTPLQRRSIMAVAHLVGSPAGLLMWRRGEQFLPLATWNISTPTIVKLTDTPVRAAQARDGVAELLHTQGGVIELKDSDRTSALVIPQWLARVRDAWLVVPLIAADRLEGYIVLTQPAVPPRLSQEINEMLVAVGQRIAVHLAEEPGVKKSDERPRKADFGVVPPFIVHDLKNIMGQLALIPNNAEKHRDNPVFVDDMLSTIKNAVERIRCLTDCIREGRYSDNVQKIDVADALRKALRKIVETKSADAPEPILHDGGGGVEIWADPEKLITAITNLVRNAQEAAGRDGRVTIVIHNEGDETLIDIRDNGCGMNQEFIDERLFTPLETTKADTGLGIGAYQARKFVLELGGRIEVRSEPGVETLLRMRFPMAPVDQNRSPELKHTEVLA